MESKVTINGISYNAIFIKGLLVVVEYEFQDQTYHPRYTFKCVMYIPKQN